MSGIEIKHSGQQHQHTYLPTTPHHPAGPSPYSPPQPPYWRTVVQPAPNAVIHPGTATAIHGPGVMTVRQPGVSAVVVTNAMSPNPTVFLCPSCNQQIVTRVEYKPSMRTHLIALLLCVVGCWPLVCLPYCMDTCNNVNHYCAICNAYIGSYRS